MENSEECLLTADKLEYRRDATSYELFDVSYNSLNDAGKLEVDAALETIERPKTA